MSDTEIHFCSTCGAKSVWTKEGKLLSFEGCKPRKETRGSKQIALRAVVAP